MISTSSYDLANWGPGTKIYTDHLVNKKRSIFKNSENSNIVLSKWKSRELYALVSSILGIEPNGTMTMLIRGLPMNNPFWWDFIVTNGRTLVHIMCGNSMVEVLCLSNEKDFSIDDFLEFNMTKYRDHIERKIKEYEIHNTYINHYDSYRKTSEYLWREVKKINLDKPVIRERNAITSQESKLMFSDMKRYSRNSLKFHSLGKALVLNSAFMAESYINLLARVGSRDQSHQQLKRVKEFSRRTFQYKVENLYLHCMGILGPIDAGTKPIQDMLNVMTLRNKYVHSDLTSKLNTLEPIYFDDMYPLMDSPNHNFAVDSLENSMHNPSIKTTLDSYETSKVFIEYIKGLIRPQYVDFFDSILGQSIITQNTKSLKYSIIYPDEIGLSIPISGS